MKVGDLVINIYTKEVGLITDTCGEGYVTVDERWNVPEDHLRAIQ